MLPEHRRLARLQRLEKVRDLAKQAAAREAAEAESTLAQLSALAARTGQLVADYAARIDVRDGGQLRQLAAFRSGLTGVSQATTGDALRARGLADAKLAELAAAERRRQAAEDRAKVQADAIVRAAIKPVLSARRASGTGLERNPA